MCQTKENCVIQWGQDVCCLIESLRRYSKNKDRCIFRLRTPEARLAMTKVHEAYRVRLTSFNLPC